MSFMALCLFGFQIFDHSLCSEQRMKDLQRRNHDLKTMLQRLETENKALRALRRENDTLSQKLAIHNHLNPGLTPSPPASARNSVTTNTASTMAMSPEVPFPKGAYASTDLDMMDKSMSGVSGHRMQRQHSADTGDLYRNF